ncbi:MAG: glycosyltransferase [Edaphobacter sp.]
MSIVIPARNEAATLPRLLNSLTKQNYPHLANTRVYVADAGSTDETVAAALNFSDRLKVQVIAGGLPAVGRNAGGRQAKIDGGSRYLLFLDADVELGEPTLLQRAVEAAKARQMYCVTTNIVCLHGGFKDDALYMANNVVQRLSRWGMPFSTGMFMLFDAMEFERLGGFNEQALFAEDYLLSKQVPRSRFCVVPGSVHTGNRRFRKLGHGRMVKMFLNTMIHSGKESYFLRDHGYWETAPSEATNLLAVPGVARERQEGRTIVLGTDYDAA